MSKIVLIGGGSVLWTPTFANDLFQQEALRESCLTLVDIDPKALALMTAYCKRLNDQYEAGWIVESSELEPALDGANVVCLSISTGGLEAMHADYTIPEQYGVFHTVGDTTGPGGISRTLRNVPVFVDVAHKMEHLCPHAWLIHVTNPLSQLTRAVCLSSKIHCIGLCHNYAGTISMLSDFLKVEETDIHAMSVGINHNTWLKELTAKGQPVSDQLTVDRYVRYEQSKKGQFRPTRTTDDLISEITVSGGTMEYYLNFVLHEQFGFFPVGAASHVAENLPFYCNSEETLKRYHIRRKGVLPRRQQEKDKKRKQIEHMLNTHECLPMPEASRESFAEIVSALYTGRPTTSIVAMPNQGQISNLPPDVIVETWVQINGSGIFPLTSGPIPEALTGWMLTSIEEQELSVKAALSGNSELALRALFISPMLANKDSAKPLLQDLMQANQTWLMHMKKL